MKGEEAFPRGRFVFFSFFFFFFFLTRHCVRTGVSIFLDYVNSLWSFHENRRDYAIPPRLFDALFDSSVTRAGGRKGNLHGFFRSKLLFSFSCFSLS